MADTPTVHTKATITAATAHFDKAMVDKLGQLKQRGVGMRLDWTGVDSLSIDTGRFLEVCSVCCNSANTVLVLCLTFCVSPSSIPLATLRLALILGETRRRSRPSSHSRSFVGAVAAAVAVAVALATRSQPRF